MQQRPHGRLIRRKTRAGQRTAMSATARTRPTAPKIRGNAFPWFIAASGLGSLGMVLIGIGQIFAHLHEPIITEVCTPIGVMLMATSVAPLVLGAVRVLAQESAPPMQHCGFCAHYRATSQTYALGNCALGVRTRLMTRTDACNRFQYSERAMVRDRLSSAPHVLGSVPHPHLDER